MSYNIFKKTFRSRGGRGRGQRSRPYPRRYEEEDNRLPRPTPEHLLDGKTSQEKAAARAKDDLRLARDWQTYFQKHFERERYRLPRPGNTHLLPEAEALQEKIDSILDDARTKCKEAIEEHLKSVITTAEDRVKNPPKPAEASLLEEVSKLVTQSQQNWEFMMAHMGRTMKEVLTQQETRRQEQQLETEKQPEKLGS